MLNPPLLAQAIHAAHALAVGFDDVVCRSIHLQHFTKFNMARPLFTAPASPGGTRYVLPNGPPALYAALDADTAHREGNQAFYQTAGQPGGLALIRAGAL